MCHVTLSEPVAAHHANGDNAGWLIHDPKCMERIVISNSFKSDVLDNPDEWYDKADSQCTESLMY